MLNFTTNTPGNSRHKKVAGTKRNIQATFEAGQYLQFLPLITAKCTSTTGDYIRFEGSSSLNTRLFSIRGTAGTAKVGGIRIYNGGMRLYQNGCFKFHE